jgi:membrane fusion protein, heavy metal efflux system
MQNRFFSTVVMLFVIVAGSGCGKKERVEQAAPPQEAAPATLTLTKKAMDQIGLKTEAVSAKPFSRTIVMPARVIANQDNEALVGSLVPGRVCKVMVKVGDYVRAGQPLMLVEGLEIGSIKAGFLSAKANLAYQKANLERQKKLIEENVGAQKNLLESQNEYEKALAEYHAEENRISAIGLRPDEVTSGDETQGNDRCSGALAVKSPISGIVVERNVVIGQLIEGSTNALRIVDLATVWVDGQIYEKDIDNIQNVSAANFTASAYPGRSFPGSIINIGRVIDEKTRTLTIRAELRNPEGTLKPQMFGDLSLRTGAGAKALLLPAESLAKIDNADYVFVRKDDSTFEKRAVKTGRAEGEMVEIREGLHEGDLVVTKGAFYLKSEMLKANFGEE